MVAVRSHLFNALFYLLLSLLLIPAMATFLMPRKGIIRMAQLWGRLSIGLLRVVVGTKVEFRGRERIPPGGLLVAAKHQSLFETFALCTCFDDPTFILKRELQFIPVFGWLTIKGRMIPVNRGGATALTAMNRRAAQEAREGRQIIIFPEGTRRAPGAEPAYRQGVGHLYAALEVPCLPVALNSGLYWPRRHYIRRPGTIVIEFLDLIPAGLPRGEMVDAMVERIETASDRLLAEGRAELAGAAVG